MATTEIPHLIFLSHKSDDKPEVRYLADKLEQHPLAKQHNIKTWLDERSQNHAKTYPAQFAAAINAPDTCAFLLFVPTDSTSGYVQHEIETAFDRRMSEEKQGLSFPILPVYPAEQAERIALPHPIQGLNYRANVLHKPELHQAILEDAVRYIQQQDTVTSDSETTSPVSTANDTQAPASPWLCYLLEAKGQEITAEADTKNISRIINSIPKNQLLPHSETEDYSATIEQLFPELFNTNEQPERVRVMTDDAELAMIPWRSMHPDVVIEISPYARRYHDGFETIAINTPLAVIPEEAQYGIAPNKHYSALVGYFNSHLDIRGPIPRVSTVAGLKRELQLHQPDFIYLYARYDGTHIQLDSDSAQQADNPSSLTLDELGGWLEEECRKHQLLRPIVILSLIGAKLSAYPASLAENCRLLWIQSTYHPNNATAIEDLLAQTLETLSSRQDDMVGVINNAFDRRVRSHIWLNGQSLRFNPAENTQLSGQLRAALLRVLLGREHLKNSMFGSVVKREHINNSSFLAYAVTGDRQACPFDFPAQLQSRIDWEDPENGLPLLPLYFSLTVDADTDPAEQIADALDQGLYHRTANTEMAFQSMLERRGLGNSDSCIALNWNITLPVGMVGQLGEWLHNWGVTMCDEIADYIPPRTIMLSALCIQVDDQASAQNVQDIANQCLHTLRDFNIRLIRNRDALGKLEMDEISDFLEYNEHWRKHLKLRDYNIDPYHYAGWVYERTDGEFDATVNTIWTQYQQDYQDYPKS